MRRLFLLLLFCISTLNASLILLDDTQKNENFSIQYLYDEDSYLDIEDVQNINFTQRISSQFTQGYKYGNAWFKISLTNKSKNEDFVLYFTESIWSTLDLYSRQGTTWKVQKNGLNILLTQRSIKDSLPAFSVHIETGKDAVFYVKGQTIASQIGEFQIYTQEEFFNPNRITITEWYMIYAFVLFAFVLLNFYNFIMTREAIYAYYIGYVLVYIVFSFMHSGVYMAFGFPNWHEGLHVLGQLTLFTLLLFSIEFLELKTTYPQMKKIFLYLSGIALLFSFLLSKDIAYATIASNIFFSAVLMLIVYVAVKVLKNGFDGAKYYLLALMLYLPSMAMMAMNFNAMLPNTDITRYSFLGGAFIEIFLFTLILTNRYMEATKEKLLAQNALLEEKMNYEQTLISEIDKKTKYLTIANNKLTEQKQELQEVKEQLTIEATTDMLSGLYNRRFFFEASQKCYYNAMRYKQELAILMLDIDKFKNVNDSYGHVFGDKVIRIISNILKHASRESDIVARYGGEEFIILLPQTNLESALNSAQRIRLEIQNKEILLNTDKVIKITASIGVTHIDYKDDTSIEESITRCDKALYQAKESGRNKVCHL